MLPRVLLCAGLLSAASALLPAAQYQALLDLYTGLHGASWKAADCPWMQSNNDPCTCEGYADDHGWLGVMCDAAHENVM